MTSQDHTQTVGGVRDLADLLAHVSAATGPSIVLETQIAVALRDGAGGYPGFPLGSHCDGYVQANLGRDGWSVAWRVPPFTASLDAALALVERAAPTWTVDLTIYRTNGGEFLPHTKARLFCPYGEIMEHRADAPTAPLALVAALLKALIAQAASPTGGQLGPGLPPENPSRIT